MSCQTQVKNSKNYEKTLAGFGRRFKDFCGLFSNFFVDYKKNSYSKAELYLSALFYSTLSNIQRVSESTFEHNYHELHHFISDSKWDYSPVMNFIQKQAEEQLCLSAKLTGLYIDESGNTKKGKHSVGVAKQYCGNVGKIENSQVAVYASLGNSDFSTLIDSKLYLPKQWISDKVRCNKACIPVRQRVFKTKQQIALELIDQQVNKGTRFDFISVDALYGADQEFTDALDQRGLIIMGDIRSNQNIFLEEPIINVPERKGNIGRIPKNKKASGQEVKVCEYIKTLKQSDWIELKVRNTAKGKLTDLYHFVAVWIWDGQSNKASKRTLMIRKSKKKKKADVKYSLTNAELIQYTEKALAYMQAQRFFIEHNFKEAKSVLGMNQFQTRKWISWYHQTALIFILLLFVMLMKIQCLSFAPLLSAWDLKQILGFLLQKNIKFDMIARQVLFRHKIRQYDINRCYSKC